MVKKYTVFAFVLAMTFVGCDQQKEHSKDVKVITVDTSTAESKLDVSEMLDFSQVEIIKLETNEDCIVSSGGTILTEDDYIIIGDRTTKHLSLFNRDGSFVRNIGVSGRGPGEYIQLGGFTVVNDSVYIQDAVQTKVVVYPLAGEGFREMNLDPPIYHVNLFSNDDRLYFITNYASIKAKKRHSANLVGMDMESGDRDYYIPFDPEIEEKRQAWGLNRYSSTSGSETLVIFGRNDTIYHVNGGDVRAQYVVYFVRGRIPESLLQQDAVIAFKGALDNGYTTGLDKISNLPDYILGEFSEGTKIYRMVYGKLQNKVSVGKSLVVNGMGELQVLDFHTTDNNELVLVYDVYVLHDLWEYVVSKKEFADAALKEVI